MIDISKAKVNRRIPKNRFIFDTSGIDTIYWRYKLSTDTIGLRSSEDALEMQIMEVKFKSNIDKTKLPSIQKAIPYQILFLCGDTYYMVISGRVISTTKPLITDDKLDIDAVSIKGMVEQLAKTMLDVDSDSSGDIGDIVDRELARQKLEKEVSKLEKAMYAETQPKKKFELHEEWLKKTEELRRI